MFFDIWANKIRTTQYLSWKKKGKSKFTIGGTAHLTKYLMHYQNAFACDEPVDYLSKYLTRKCYVERVNVPPWDTSCLKISVHSAGYEIVPGLDPQRDNYESYYSITTGKPNGMANEDSL